MSCKFLVENKSIKDSKLVYYEGWSVIRYMENFFLYNTKNNRTLIILLWVLNLIILAVKIIYVFASHLPYMYW